MRTEAEADRAVKEYADMIRRICFIHLKNDSDVEDVFQDVFLKYILYDQVFESDAHEKAWLLRVAINRCKDLLKSYFRRKVVSIEGMEQVLSYVQEENREVLDAVLQLPEKYKDVIYLFYYEGYTAGEIGKILNKNENTIYTWLARARVRLKDALGGEPLGR